MAAEWHVHQNGRQTGPFTSAQLQQMAAAGTLSPADLVTKAGAKQWMPAGQIKGLSFSNATPPHLPPLPAQVPPLPQGVLTPGSTQGQQVVQSITPRRSSHTFKVIGAIVAAVIPLIACCGLGGLGVHLWRKGEQERRQAEEARVALAKTGAYVTPDYVNFHNYGQPAKFTKQDLVHLVNLPKLKKLSFEQTAITDDDMAALRELKALEELDLTKTGITDAGLGHLEGLKTLKVLKLNKTQVSDAGLSKLRNVTSLSSLDLSETRATDKGVADLCHLPLQNLQLFRTETGDMALASLKGTTTLIYLGVGKRTTDSGLEHIARLPQLASLSLIDARLITNAGMIHVGRLNTLKDLSLNGLISDDGLASLTTLRGLEYLMLGTDTPVPLTDRGILSLSQLTSLKELDLGLLDLGMNGPMVSDGAIKQLQDKLPNTKIRSSRNRIQ